MYKILRTVSLTIFREMTIWPLDALSSMYSGCIPLLQFLILFILKFPSVIHWKIHLKIQVNHTFNYSVALDSEGSVAKQFLLGSLHFSGSFFQNKLKHNEPHLVCGASSFHQMLQWCSNFEKIDSFHKCDCSTLSYSVLSGKAKKEKCPPITAFNWQLF